MVVLFFVPFFVRLFLRLFCTRLCTVACYSVEIKKSPTFRPGFSYSFLFRRSLTTVIKIPMTDSINTPTRKLIIKNIIKFIIFLFLRVIKNRPFDRSCFI